MRLGSYGIVETGTRYYSVLLPSRPKYTQCYSASTSTTTPFTTVLLPIVHKNAQWIIILYRVTTVDNIQCSIDVQPHTCTSLSTKIYAPKRQENPDQTTITMPFAGTKLVTFRPVGVPGLRRWFTDLRLYSLRRNRELERQWLLVVNSNVTLPYLWWSQ